MPDYGITHCDVAKKSYLCIVIRKNTRYRRPTLVVNKSAGRQLVTTASRRLYAFFQHSLIIHKHKFFTMINYSLTMRGNPSDPAAAKRAYAQAQYQEVMNLNQFASHIADHGCVYSRADIAAILTMAVDCIHELLLKGQKIQLGDLGSFWVALRSVGARTFGDFVATNNIKKVKVHWTPGAQFEDLIKEATFNQVPSRKVQAETLKEINQ